MTKQTSFGAFEAKTHFAQLVERVEGGEEILITRRGKPVAKIVPVDEIPNSESAKEAARRIRSLAKEMKLGEFNWNEWRTYRDIGRP